MSTAPDTLMDLHDRYVDAVNTAIAADDLARAEQLAQEFDLEVLDSVRRKIAGAAA